jgi:hypothetical protein
MNLDELLAAAESEGLSSYEAENLILSNAAMYPKQASAIIQRRSQTGGKGYSQPGAINRNTPKSAAQFDIVVTRNTNTIAEALPFVLFAPSDAENGYRNMIPALGVGTVLTSVRFGENVAQPNFCRFTYTNAANVDTIDVSCSQYAYPSFLQAIRNGLFQIKRFRMSLTDATATAQFNQGIDYKRRSMFGADFKDSLPVVAAKSPDQFQNVILDINGLWDIDSETGYVSKVMQHGAALSVTYSVFVEKVLKLNSLGM